MTHARQTVRTGTLVGAVILLCLSTGCASYRLGARPPTGDSGASAASLPDRVAVATVATPASRGIDATRLTDELVRQLADEGIETVRWEQRRANVAFVSCRVDGPAPDAFGASHAGQARADCRITRADDTTYAATASARHSVAGGDEPGVVDESIASGEYAASRAIRRVVPEIIERLRSTAPAPAAD